MKSHVQVAVIGGGVVGCSVLYHLTKLGWKDVLLIERSELTSGSTWHAAGGFHTLNADTNMAALQGYTIQLYRELEELSGQSCGLHHVGGIGIVSIGRGERRLAPDRCDQGQSEGYSDYRPCGGASTRRDQATLRVALQQHRARPNWAASGKNPAHGTGSAITGQRPLPVRPLKQVLAYNPRTGVNTHVATNHDAHDRPPQTNGDSHTADLRHALLIPTPRHCPPRPVTPARRGDPGPTPAYHAPRAGQSVGLPPALI